MRRAVQGGGDMKPTEKSLFDLVKPPFKAVLSNGFIVDQNNMMVARIPCLFDTHFEGELTDELHRWIVAAMNEKWMREKPHDPEEPVRCISCKHLVNWKPGYYRCEDSDTSIDPFVSEPCKYYKRRGGV
jgi:hypothetical protein